MVTWPYTRERETWTLCKVGIRVRIKRWGYVYAADRDIGLIWLWVRCQFCIFVRRGFDVSYCGPFREIALRRGLRGGEAGFGPHRECWDSDRYRPDVCSFVRPRVLLLYFLLLGETWDVFLLPFQYSFLLNSIFLQSILSCGIFIDTKEEVGKQTIKKYIPSKEGKQITKKNGTARVKKNQVQQTNT